MEGAGDRSRAVVEILDGHVEVEVVVDQVAGRPPDLAFVDALARLELEARRLGGSIRVRDPSRGLRELLDLAGLSQLIAGDRTPARPRCDAGSDCS